MRRWLTTFVSYLCFSFSAWSQTTTLPPPQQALSQVRQYLGLTDDQVNAILQNNGAYNTFSFQQQDQIRQAQSQIATEAAKDTLDPMAIGVLYVNIETICHGLRAMATSSLQQNVSLLNDAQKVKIERIDRCNAVDPDHLRSAIRKSARAGKLAAFRFQHCLIEPSRLDWIFSSGWM